MHCGYECHKIGGPWIAENPSCPIHGIDAQKDEREHEKLNEKIHDAETVSDLKEILYALTNKIYNK